MRYLYGKGLSMSQTRLRALSLVIVLIFSFLECTTSVTSPQQLDFRDLRLVRRTEPIYPPAARKRGLQGKVVLRVWVEKDGKISGMKVLNGNPIFAQAALDTVHQWRFAPDRRLPAFTTITVDFRLPSSRDLRLSNISSGDSWTTYNKTYEFQGKSYKFKARTTKESENILSPSPVFDPDPPYTPEAIKARLEGTLTLNTGICLGYELDFWTGVSPCPTIEERGFRPLVACASAESRENDEERHLADVGSHPAGLSAAALH